MPVPFLDLRLQYASIRDEVRSAVDEVLESQVCVLGPKQKKLEADIAGYCGCKFALAVSSGTDALLCALMGMGVGPGDEVVTTAFTFFATCGAVARTGAKPVFVDIDPDTFNIDASQIEAAITDRTKVILPVHLYGQCADMTAIMAIANARGVDVLEDAAQAIGAKHAGKSAGSFGRAGCLSFYPTKNLNATGDAGMVVTSDEALLNDMRIIRVHGDAGGYDHVIMGGNFRMDELQAAILNVKFTRLESWHAGRRRVAKLYDQLLADVDEVKCPIIAAGNESVYGLYVIRAANRDGLRAFLGERKIGCSVYYPRGQHTQKVFSHLGYKQGDFPETEKVATEVLALPIFPEMTDEQVVEVAEAIKAFYAGR